MDQEIRNGVSIKQLGKKIFNKRLKITEIIL
jgi:hypothetical protein